MPSDIYLNDDGSLALVANTLQLMLQYGDGVPRVASAKGPLVVLGTPVFPDSIMVAFPAKHTVSAGTAKPYSALGAAGGHFDVVPAVSSGEVALNDLQKRLTSGRAVDVATTLQDLIVAVLYLAGRTP